MDSLIADLKRYIMTKQKEIGYEVGNVAWHNLTLVVWLVGDLRPRTYQNAQK